MKYSDIEDILLKGADTLEKHAKTKNDEEGTRHYERILPLAYNVFSSWPLPKQIRGTRQLKKYMEKAGIYGWDDFNVDRIIQSIQEGKRTPPTSALKLVPERSGDLITIAYAFREIARENRNPDKSDPYWEQIKGATVIEPFPIYDIVIFSNEDGKGNLSNCKWEKISENVLKDIEKLEGKNVIFFPIKTDEESSAFNHAQHGPEIAFEFEVKSYNSNARLFNGAVGGTIKAEEYNPLTKEDAERIKNFLKNSMKEPKEERYIRAFPFSPKVYPAMGSPLREKMTSVK